MPVNSVEAPVKIVNSDENAVWPGIESSNEASVKESISTAVRSRLGARPVQLSLSAEAFEKLTDLKEKLGVASKTEVVRLGLGVLSWIVEELSENHKILVERAPGHTAELAFPYLNIKKKAR